MIWILLEQKNISTTDVCEWLSLEKEDILVLKNEGTKFIFICQTLN